MSLDFQINVDPKGNVGVLTRETHFLDHPDGRGVTEMIGLSTFVQGSPIGLPNNLPPPEMVIRGPEMISTTRW